MPATTIPAVPLVRAGVFAPFLRAAREAGSSVARIMDRVSIPSLVEEDPFLVVPSLPVWRFMRVVERQETDLLYGLRVAAGAPPTNIPSLRPLFRGCLTLKELLRRLCAAVPTQSNLVQYVLREEGDFLWIEDISQPLLPQCLAPSLFHVAGMIQIVQLAAGESWRPPFIVFNCPYHREIDTAPEFNPSRILFDQPTHGIAIPRHLLALPAVLPEPGEPQEEIPDPLTSLRDLPSQILRVLPSFLRQSNPEIRSVASAVGMSVRTLQRRLAEAGTSWSRLLERARFLTARKLLTETNLKIADIAHEVGYTHPSTFCKAFRQLAGVPPAEYRRHHCFANTPTGPGPARQPCAPPPHRHSPSSRASSPPPSSTPDYS